MFELRKLFSREPAEGVIDIQRHRGQGTTPGTPQPTEEPARRTHSRGMPSPRMGGGDINKERRHMGLMLGEGPDQVLPDGA